MATAYTAKIMLIEDDLDITDLIKNFFKQKQLELIHFDNAEAAINELEKNNTHYDVIITDLKLPEMSGIDFIKVIKEKNVLTPVIVMTANRALDTALQAIEAGAYDFIVKPLHFPQLIISIERAIHMNQLNKENTTLRETIKESSTSAAAGYICKSQNFQKCIDLAKRVANSVTNVLITGESGTGKEIISKLIHNSSSRAKGPFLAINCSAIPETLLESELFGYVKGAFTGANDKKIGMFEAAENGTLFLDEIGDLSLPLQAKLLRVLQEKKIKRIGENVSRNINARVISATHKDLRTAVSQGQFREDLFFRLNVIPIHIPPLRERKEDIIPLAEYFLKKYSATNGIKNKHFSKAVLQILISRPWKGNVRELENTIERCVVLSENPTIEEKDLFLEEIEFSTAADSTGGSDDFSGLVSNEGRLLSMNELSLRYIEFALQKNNGAKDKTAKELGIDRKTLYRKVQELNARDNLNIAQN